MLVQTMIFFAGIALMVLGPLVSLLALSSCFGTIPSTRVEIAAE